MRVMLFRGGHHVVFSLFRTCLSCKISLDRLKQTSLTVSLVSKRYMRGVAEMKFSSLFVRI